MTTTAVDALSRVLIATIVERALGDERAPGGDHRFREPSRCPERNCRLVTKAGICSRSRCIGAMNFTQERGIHAATPPSLVLLERNLAVADEILIRKYICKKLKLKIS